MNEMPKELPAERPLRMPFDGRRYVLKGPKDGPISGYFVPNHMYKFGGYWQLNKSIWPGGGPTHWGVPNG